MGQPQILVPGSTVDNGGFGIVGQAASPTHHEAVDKGYPDRGAPDRVQSGNNPVNASIKFGALKDAYSGSALFDPGTDDGFLLAAYVRNSATSSTVDHTVSLRKNDGTVVHSFTRQVVDSTAFRWIVNHVPVADAANIDWADLEVWYTANKVSGGNVRGECASVYLACPGDDLSRSLPAGVPADPIAWWTADSLTHLADTADVDSWQDERGGRHLQVGALPPVVGGVVPDPPSFTSSEPDMHGLPVLQFRTDQSTFMEKLGAVWTELGQGHTYIIHRVPRKGALGDEGIVDWPEQLVLGHALGWPVFFDRETPREYGLNEQGGGHIFGGSPVDGAETVNGAQYAAPTDNDAIYEDGVLVAGPADMGEKNSAGVAVGWRQTFPIDNAGNYDIHCIYLYGRVLTAQEHSDLSDALMVEGAAFDPANLQATVDGSDVTLTWDPSF